MQRFQSRHLFQLREIGLGLTCIGGFIDAYTFIQRGGVLAAGQTGNLIFLSVDVAQWNLPGVLTKLATVLFFTLGVIVVGILKQWLGARSHYWRLPVLVAELVVCLMVGMLPATVSNAMVVPPLAFVMAMQTTAFSAIAGEGPLLEYSGVLLAFFHMASALKMVVALALGVVLFFPGTISDIPAVNLVWFVVKCALFMLFTLTVVKSATGRLRIEQALSFFLAGLPDTV